MGYWISTDPKEQFWSLYSYTGNGFSPVNGIDADGCDFGVVSVPTIIAGATYLTYTAPIWVPRVASGLNRASMFWARHGPTVIAAGYGMAARANSLYLRGVQFFESRNTWQDAMKFAIPAAILSRFFPTVDDVFDHFVQASGNDFLGNMYTIADETVDFVAELQFNGLVEGSGAPLMLDGPAPIDNTYTDSQLNFDD